jgi:hypothetical protein
MNIGNLAENHKSLANHASDFEQMFYNIWKQQTKDGRLKSFRQQRNALARQPAVFVHEAFRHRG